MNNLAVKQTSSNQSFVKVENQTKPATKRQLWALFAASKKVGKKHDYRNDNLTMQQASELLQALNKKQTGIDTPTQTKAVRKPKNSLEREFIEYVKAHMESVVNIARQAINMKSLLTDDPLFTPDPKKRRTWGFVGFGCGFSHIRFDRRSKVGKQIEELSRKHRHTTFLQHFLKSFTTQERKALKDFGCPIEAVYAQDVQIGAYYMALVREFMELKGVKKTWVQTFDD